MSSGISLISPLPGWIEEWLNCPVITGKRSELLPVFMTDFFIFKNS